MIAERGNNEAVKKVDSLIMKEFSPKKYHGSDGIEVKSVKLFNTLCTILEYNNIQNPKRLTTLEFYQKLEMIEEQQKQMKKSKR